MELGAVCVRVVAVSATYPRPDHCKRQRGGERLAGQSRKSTAFEIQKCNKKKFPCGIILPVNVALAHLDCSTQNDAFFFLCYCVRRSRKGQAYTSSVSDMVSVDFGTWRQKKSRRTCVRTVFIALD